MIGRLKPVELREIWKHEATNFTTWLFNNLDILNEQLGLSLTGIECEKSVGPFSVDIFAEDTSGRHVIIENQLTRTDHDHLGKVLTYMTNLDAKVAIWITSDPRPEHLKAVDYLNENLPADTQFYVVKLQAFKIEDSKPAPLFTIESGPSPERSAGGAVKKELAAKDTLRYDFFSLLLTTCNSKTTLFSNVKPVGYQGWVNAGAGKSGLMWLLEAGNKFTKVGLFFCSASAEINKKRYDSLLSHKDEIEQLCGMQLNWEFSESRKQQYIRFSNTLNIFESQEAWQRVCEDLVDRLIRLESAMRSFINQLA